ncbi:Tetratricopeptide repeat-containing protein [Maridesulfovibrio ferrireducens]|uniref:Tetratricopeptide repeat-containing protein n=1 Tax=Maridesulfovibrio ferrireducens TaxID=246191 RepID=A0A1G9F1V0_9BACT|nr:tetratricopeptide repeat protein [Maridesulfovibrio ferrireducens]SDK82364.1 Tetratricopeptide repeat-containing protein [Maridesulfovibrio ferrireducens]
MNIKLWRILLFALIIIGATVLIYPFPRDMVPLYLKSGEIAKASDLISTLLDENPDDLQLLTIGADVYLVRGLPDKAIASLNRVLEFKPEDLAVLEKLVQFYEWNVMPREALHTWERISKISSKRKKPFEQMVMYYRFYNMIHDEVGAIIKLNRLQSTREIADVFQKGINLEVARLSDKYDEQKEDPYQDYLIRHIFIVGEQFRVALANNEKINYLEFVTYALEYYVEVDRVEEALSFASYMDNETEKGLRNRIQLVKVLGWSQQYTAALDLAEKLYKLKPDSTILLKEMVWLAQSLNRYDLAEFSLEQLVRIEPDNNQHREDLGNMYMQTGKFGQAVALFRDLADKIGNFFKYAHNMLRAALYSSDTQLMAEVVAETESLNISDPEYQRTRAELLLGLNRPREAYAMLRAVAEGPGGEIEDYVRLLDAAGATGDDKLVAETIDLALRFKPDDISLMRQGAEAWMNAGNPLKSYQLYSKVVRKEGQEKDVIGMLLAAAETQKIKTAKEAAGYATKVLPDNIKVLSQAGEIMLWLNSPVDGYPYYKKAAVLTGGEKEAVMRLMQVASFTADSKIFRDAAITAVKLRPYDEQVAMLAAGVWAAAGDVEKAKQLIVRFADRKGETYEMLLQWAEFADKSGLTEEAYRLYDQIYSLNFKDKKVRANLARLAGWTNRPKVSAKLFGEMSDEQPGSFSLAIQAAKGYSDSAEYAKAVGYYERALSLKTSDTDLKLELALNYGLAGMNAKRIILLQDLYVQGVLPQGEKIELARAYLEEKDPQKALEILEPYARLKTLPRFEGFLLASAYDLAGRGRNASDIYKRLGREHNKDGIFMARLGAEALFNNHIAEAFSLFESALRVDKKNQTALKGIAIIYTERNEYKRAIAKFKAYNRIVPDDADARFQLGEIYLLVNREGDAVREFKKAKRILKRQGQVQKNLSIQAKKIIDRE